MISIDTNVIVRTLTNDDPEQARRAAAVLRSPRLLLSKTVLVEVEWVLRKTYGFRADRIHGAFGKLVALRGLMVEDRGAITVALDWYAQGMDFADAVHLASSAAARTFATFDGPLVKAVKRLAITPTATLV